MPGREVSIGKIIGGGLHRNGNTDVARASVLFALTEHERSLFFGDSLPDSDAGARFEWVSPDDGTPSEWTEHYRPTVIVSSWKTPALFDSPGNGFPGCVSYICHLGGSVRHIVQRTFIEQGGLVTNWGSSVADTVAEHALLLILGSLRKMGRWAEVFTEGKSWSLGAVPTRTLFGKRVGVHGFGAVARNLVSLLQPFGVDIAAYSEGVPAKTFQQFGVRQCASLEELFDGSEVLVECEALTPRTKGIVSRKLLSHLQRNAVFINIGRGALIDEEALVDLAVRKSFSLGLDVYESEPMPADHLLLANPDALLSPHIGGPTCDRLADCGRQALENIQSFFAGLPLENVISVEIYDRAT
jgi:phosphoglycerate dehydrogenase-like enzyme